MKYVSKPKLKPKSKPTIETLSLNLCLILSLDRKMKRLYTKNLLNNKLKKFQNSKKYSFKICKTDKTFDRTHLFIDRILTADRFEDVRLRFVVDLPSTVRIAR